MIHPYPPFFADKLFKGKTIRNRSMLSAFRLLTLLALPAAIEAFYSMGKSRLNAMSNLDDMIMQPMNANCHNNKDSSVSYLYGSEDPDPNRRVQKIVVMGAKRKKVRQRSENEKFMEELVIGRWKLEVSEISRSENDKISRISGFSTSPFNVFI